MPISPARSAAFKVLLRVEREAAYAVELLHSPLLDGVSAIDRNLSTEIVMGVLRWRSLLDAALADFLVGALSRLDLEVHTALRMGVYQLLFLDRTPGHAIVNETVELVKRAGKRSASALVNAVMRKLEAKRDVLRAGRADPGALGLAAAYAHPPWLVERWIARFGQEKAGTICRFNQQPPPTVLRTGGMAEEEEELRSGGLRLAPGALLKNARIVIRGDVTKSEPYLSGRIAIQDEASQLVAALLGKGWRVLDCCAAPGSKTGALAAALPEAEIVAAEIQLHRARLLRKMVSRENVLVIAADARSLPFGADFDCVLVDAPCSGTGTLARNPEIKWKLAPDDIDDLQQRQTAILNAALQHVTQGGRLVYSTCSLEREENEQVVQSCLQDHPAFKITPVQDELRKLRDAGALAWKNVEELVSGDFLQTLPGVHPCDGFFAAILEKRKSWFSDESPP